MLAAAASVITQAIRSPCSAKAASTAATSLYGRTSVSPACAPVTPGVSGQAEGGDAGAGGGEQRVDVAVVAAGELHHRRPGR